MRVLLADDHHLFLEGLRNLLTSEGIEVVGMARDGFEAFQQARALRPDLILMDVRMPRCSGIEATRLIKAEMPECKIVMLTMSEDEDDVFEAVKSGADGYLLKYLNAEHFFGYLRDAKEGRAVFSRGIAGRILNEFKRTSRNSQLRRASERAADDEGGSRLSPQQAMILTLVAEGVTYKEVAQRMGITERTVKYHMGEILERLHLENRAQAIAYAAEMRRRRNDGDETPH